MDSQKTWGMYTLVNKTQLSSFLCFFQETNVGIYTLKTPCLPECCEGLAGLGILSEEMMEAKLLSFTLPSPHSAWLSHDNPQGD